jgi:DHA2 family multidrug resistance protein
MVPLAQMATVGIAPAQAGNASALFNMVRNLGGSMGIALLSTLVQNREHYHFSVIAERITRNSAAVADRLAGLARHFAPHGGEPHTRAIAELARMVRREALVMAYGDSFFLIGVALVIAIGGTFFLARATLGGGEAH